LTFTHKHDGIRIPRIADRLRLAAGHQRRWRAWVASHSLCPRSMEIALIVWTATFAALAVALVQIVLAYKDPAFVAPAGSGYWKAIALSSLTLWLLYLIIGLLALRAGRPATTESGESMAGNSGVVNDRIEEIAAHRERLATVGEITAQVVHGLSSPLTGITTILDDMLQGCDGAEREPLELVKSEAERASAIVRQLLCFTRRDVANPVVSLNEVTERAIDLFALRYPSGSVAISSELSPKPTEARAGPGQLEQVVLNLLDNARHAINGSNRGEITVRTHVNGKRVVLEVSDNGSGIPLEIQDRIFEPFFTTKDPGEGTGLGLAIVASVIREHGGEISVRSTPGSGTAFSISLLKPA